MCLSMCLARVGQHNGCWWSGAMSPHQSIELMLLVKHAFPDIKVHGANIGLTWVLSAPDGPYVGPMNLAIRVSSNRWVMRLQPWLQQTSERGMPVSFFLNVPLLMSFIGRVGKMKHMALSRRHENKWSYVVESPVSSRLEVTHWNSSWVATMKTQGYGFAID